MSVGAGAVESAVDGGSGGGEGEGFGSSDLASLTADAAPLLVPVLPEAAVEAAEYGEVTSETGEVGVSTRVATALFGSLVPTCTIIAGDDTFSGDGVASGPAAAESDADVVASAVVTTVAVVVSVMVELSDARVPTVRITCGGARACIVRTGGSPPPLPLPPLPAAALPPEFGIGPFAIPLIAPEAAIARAVSFRFCSFAAFNAACAKYRIACSGAECKLAPSASTAR